MKTKNGISREDPQAVEKLQAKLDACKASQEKMKAVNAYYRKNETLKDCPYLTAEEIESVTENMRRLYPIHDKPYPSYYLTNNSAEIRRLEKRLEELSRDKETGFVGWIFEGGEAVANEEACRLQLFFDEKPSEEQRMALKRSGFVWSPTNEAWQRQLNGNAIRAANYIDFIKPLDGRRPSELQPKMEPKNKGREER